MNSKQRRKNGRYMCQLVKTIGKLLTDEVKDWKENPNITKEYIIEQLEKVSDGVKELSNVKNLNSTKL